MSTFSPSTCGWWCYGWLTLLLGAGGMAAERAATPAAPAARPASAPAFAPTVRGGFMVPEYDTQNRKKSLLSGQEARARSASVWEIKVLKIETYAEGEKLTWVVEAPDCLFDYQSKSATSASRLQAHSTDGQFAISGTGFEWRQADSSLLISNQVLTVIKMVRGGSNQPPTLGATSLEVRSQRFRFSTRKSEAVYSGGVTVTELGRDAAKGTPMVMACEELTVRTLPGGGLESILAEQTVQITQGDNVVSGSRAVYAASNDVVQVSGFARWRTPQAEGEGNVLVLDRQRDQFRARGDTRTRLLGKAGEGMLTVPLEGKKDPIATNEVTEIFADQLQVGLPLPGQPVSSMIAEHRVRINYGANRAEGDRAVYLLTNGLPVVRLDGNGHWRTPEAEGRADTLVFNRAAGEFKGEGNGWLKLARPGAPKAGLPAASVPTALEVTASNYFLRGPAAEFTGGVKVADAAWNLACDRMQLALGANNRVKSIRALQGVTVGQSPAAPAGGTRLESRLRCEELDATMSATGQQMEKVNARNQVTVEQWATPAGGARNLQWTLAAQAAELIMVPGGQTVKTITASGQVQVRQMGLNALGLPVPTWTLGCVNLGLAMAEGGTRVQKAAARKEVVIEQGLVSGTNQAGPWKIRCEEMDLRMAAATNQLEHVTAHTGVIIDQAGSQARAETAEFNNLTQRVELTGHPWLRVLETKGKSGKEPQALEIRNAEVLIWDRQSNRFSGRGPFQIESLSPLPSLEPPSKP